METIQMNLTSPVYGYKALNVTEMTECNGELLISLSGKECYDIYQNQQLMFKRYIYENDRQWSVIIRLPVSCFLYFSTRRKTK